MLEALNFVLEDGRCPRQYTLPVKAPTHGLKAFHRPGLMEHIGCFDISQANRRYGILNESCGCRADEEKGVGACSEICDSVLDHLIRIMDYLLRTETLGIQDS